MEVLEGEKGAGHRCIFLKTKNQWTVKWQGRRGKGSGVEGVCRCNGALPEMATDCYHYPSGKRYPPSRTWRWAGPRGGTWAARSHCWRRAFWAARWGWAVRAPRRPRPRPRRPPGEGPGQPAGRPTGWTARSRRRSHSGACSSWTRLTKRRLRPRRRLQPRTRTACWSWWAGGRTPRPHSSARRAPGWGWRASGAAAGAVPAGAARVARAAAPAAAAAGGAGSAPGLSAERRCPRRLGWRGAGSSGRAWSRWLGWSPGRSCPPPRSWCPWTRCCRRTATATRRAPRAPEAAAAAEGAGGNSSPAGAAIPSASCRGRWGPARPRRGWGQALRCCPPAWGSLRRGAWTGLRLRWVRAGAAAAAAAAGAGAGFCFCPSVNHPAWFAQLKREKRETRYC